VTDEDEGMALFAYSCSYVRPGTARAAKQLADRQFGATSGALCLLDAAISKHAIFSKESCGCVTQSGLPKNEVPLHGHRPTDCSFHSCAYERPYSSCSFQYQLARGLHNCIGGGGIGSGQSSHEASQKARKKGDSQEALDKLEKAKLAVYEWRLPAELRDRNDIIKVLYHHHHFQSLVQEVAHDFTFL
jgi:hypothetical protein